MPPGTQLFSAWPKCTCRFVPTSASFHRPTPSKRRHLYRRKYTAYIQTHTWWRRSCAELDSLNSIIMHRHRHTLRSTLAYILASIDEWRELHLPPSLIMKIICHQKWVHTVKLEMYVGVGRCCTPDVAMLILNTFNMQNADEHFPLEGFEMLLHLHSARNIWKNNRWGGRDNRIKDGVLGSVCHFIILLLEL